MNVQKQIKQAIAANQKAFFKDLDSVLRIPSVKGKAEIGAPFGKENREVLEQVMLLANDYGFASTVVQDAVGYAQLRADEEYIGVVGHLDVVAAGSGWSYPPYQLSEEKGVLYGRGILDNKGPIMACLFGLKLLKELQLPLKKNVRIIFGTDEESGSSDLPLYLAKEKPPVFGFTPDCKYPVVYGERGIVNVTISTDVSPAVLATISEIKGEQGRAFIPDQLSCDLNGQTYTVQGKRAPSNAPDLGLNAITLLAAKLSEQAELAPELKAYFTWIQQALHGKHDGEGLDIAFEDEDSGRLMVTPYELSKEVTGLSLSLAIRYPVSVSEEEVLQRLSHQLPDDSQLTVVRRIPSTSFPKDDVNVLQLAEVYEEVTGMDGTPVTTTGATYARFMPNIVAFGPSFPGQKGIAHNADEYMPVADLLKNMEIYMLAIYRLANS